MNTVNTLCSAFRKKQRKMLESKVSGASADEINTSKLHTTISSFFCVTEKQCEVCKKRKGTVRETYYFLFYFTSFLHLI